MRDPMLLLVAVMVLRMDSIGNILIRLAEYISIILHSNMFSKLHAMASVILASTPARARIIGTKEFQSIRGL